MKKLFLSVLTFSFLSFNVSAGDWKIVPSDSSIKFSVKQNSSVITGGFSKFFGKINFDKNNLSSSNVEITIDMTSLNTSLSDATATLPSKDWLDSKSFATAKFEAKKFTKVGNDQFKAEGNLTIKGKSAPVTLEFYFPEYSDKKAKATGRATIKRDSYIIGAKDAANAHGVENDVKVEFTLTATK